MFDFKDIQSASSKTIEAKKDKSGIVYLEARQLMNTFNKTGSINTLRSAARKLAESLGIRLPVLELVESLYRDHCATGGEDLDHSALYTYLQRRCR